jgi:hypothetical protein
VRGGIDPRRPDQRFVPARGGVPGARTLATKETKPGGTTGFLPWQPSDDNLLIANGDPATAVIAGGGVDKGQLALSRIAIRQPVSINSLVTLYIPGTTTGAGTVYLGVYDPTGLLVAQTADFSATLAANDAAHVSPVTVALTSTAALTAQNYWIAELPVYANLTFGQPSLWGWAQNQGSSFDLTGNPGTTRCGLYGAPGTYTTLPASITPASIIVPLENSSVPALLTWYGGK